MEDQKRFFDVWFVQTNTVYKEVPFTVVTDWVQQSRLQLDDMIKPAGAPNWFRLGGLPMFQPYVPQPAHDAVGDVAEALEPVEMDVGWKRRFDDEDDDVDMIPLIDISLVLLIFFMMTTTVAAISRISVPDMFNASTIETNPRVLRIDVDKSDNEGGAIFAVGLGTQPPTEENDKLGDVDSLSIRIDVILQRVTEPPEVRIAANRDLPYEVVEKVMRKMDQLQNSGQITHYFIEVNERSKH